LLQDEPLFPYRFSQMLNLRRIKVCAQAALRSAADSITSLGKP
jgi:hypothetical protein